MVEQRWFFFTLKVQLMKYYTNISLFLNFLGNIFITVFNIWFLTFFSLIEEPTTISEYFNPINNVASTTIGDPKDFENVENETENVELQRFEDQNEQNLINILASTTTSKPRTTTTKDPSLYAFTTTPKTEESTLLPDETDILEILSHPTTSEPQTTTPETTTTSTTSTTETPTTIRITAKEQARMCLFHGICDVNQIQKFAKSGKPTSVTTTSASTTTTTTTTTTSKSTTAKSSASFALVAQIQRCIQTPEFCNTNLIPMNKNNAATPTPTATGTSTSTTTKVSTTTTATSTTLDPLEIAR